MVDNFMSEKSPLASENDLGELTRIDKLIIMDDVSGLADKSDDFSNFLSLENMAFLVSMFFILFTLVDRAGR